jgi:hypothetical protein
MEMIRLYEVYQNIQARATNTLAQMGRAAARKAEINKLTTHSGGFSCESFTLLAPGSNLMDVGHGRFLRLQKTVDIPVSKQEPDTTRKSDKQVSVEEGSEEEVGNGEG